MMQINKQQVLKEKLLRKEEKLENEDEEHKRETLALEEYEEHFKSKLAMFEKELDDIASL